MVPLRKPPAGLGVLAAVVAVGAVTLLLFALRELAPVISLGVVYLVAVLFVAAVWDLWLGLLAAVLSGLAFNLFHIPPTGRLTIADSENWAALVVFFIAAIVAGSLARAVRAQAVEAEDRRREADLAAELARVLLGTDDLESALAPAAQRVAAAFGLASAAIVVGDGGDDGPRRLRLAVGEDAALVVPRDVPDAVRERLERAVVPTLAALLRAAGERRRLLHEVVETRALRRSEEVKTTLLRTVSHDLRTPLTAIAASAEALAADGVDDDDRRALALGTAEHAHRLARLVDGLLDLSRLEAGRAEPRRQWVAIDEVLEAAAEGLPAERIDLRPEEGLPLVHADAAQLERAFHNLLDNGVRHGGDGVVVVRAAGVGAKVVVRVTDRGPGIGELERARIFEPFSRVGTGTATTGGAGLGLAIARGFVEANGGTVDVESFPGQGASFVVKLPLVEGAR